MGNPEGVPQTPPDAPPPAPDLDRAVGGLADRAAVFARTPPREKAALLRAALQHILAAGPAMVAASCAAAEVDPSGPLAGAAWLLGPVALLATARRFAEALEDIAASGRPTLPPDDLRGRIEGRVAVPLAPRGFAERTLHRGAEAIALFAEGVAPEDVIAGHAAFYRQPNPAGGVAVAAGPLQALDALFVEGKATLLEMAPARAHLAPIVERALAPIVEAGFLQVAKGSDAPSSYRAAPGEPVAVRSGGGPAIVVPTLYATDEIAFVVLRLVSEIAAGAAFGADAPTAIVVSGCWPQRKMFAERLERALATLPPEASRSLVRAEAPSAGAVALVEVGCDDPAEMLAAAVDRCNAWPEATTAEIVAHPLHEEDPAVEAALARAAVKLRCGALGIDQWPALVAVRGDAPAGPRMLARVDKAIVRGPLRTLRRPAYFAAGRGAGRRGERLAAFQAAPGLGALLRLMRG